MVKNKTFKDPASLFKNVLDALGINIRGAMSHSRNASPKPVKNLKGNFEEEQEQLTQEFKKILNKDDVYNSYR
ncbi:hypothetical protein C9439_02880 [archaeon SCG-AAA382B04]|nr:hypothetical protein C9439_02880 [archaeon SCG-AAA382B04]